MTDDPEQILAHHADLVNDPERPLVVLLTPVFQEHQPPRDGWRREK